MLLRALAALPPTYTAVVAHFCMCFADQAHRDQGRERGLARGVGRVPFASISGCTPPPWLLEGCVTLCERLNWTWNATLAATFGGNHDQCVRKGRLEKLAEVFAGDYAENFPADFHSIHALHNQPALSVLQIPHQCLSKRGSEGGASDQCLREGRWDYPGPAIQNTLENLDKLDTFGGGPEEGKRAEFSRLKRCDQCLREGTRAAADSY